MNSIELLKIENGKTKAYTAKGTFIKFIGDSGATDARVQGGVITISYNTGKTKIYDMNGVFKKYL